MFNYYFRLGIRSLRRNMVLTVLMIAASGASMIPIGRWEKPVKGLARRGVLRAEDAVNYVITDAGRAASESAERDADEDLRRARAG